MPIEVTTEPTLAWEPIAEGVEIYSPAWTPAARRVLTPEALAIIERLHRLHDPVRRSLLASRHERQQRWNQGELPAYLPPEAHPDAQGSWQIQPLPQDLLRRRVEITGPVGDAKMVINMLSRGADGRRADAAMLDFEDSMKPAWGQVMAGVENVRDAALGTLQFVKQGPGGEKLYEIDPEDMPLLMARCRGLHLDESNLRVDGRPVSGGMMELALCAFHSASTLLGRGRTPKYYVPKVEHYLEARWWNRVLAELEEQLGHPTGTFRATFLIETLPAALQMEEILYELRDHAAGLNVGRWDKIFSDIKVLRNHSDRVLADRASISFNRLWMRNYAERLIQICHRHGAFAMGGMAAFTPGKSAEVREEQTRRVQADKQLEAELGHDGCWVSHPYFIGAALDAFPQDNQLDVIPDLAAEPNLLPVGTPPHTLDGLRKNVRVGIAYIEGWSRDLGCVAFDDLMEDLATLEISRAQTWQWLHHRITLDENVEVTPELVGEVFDEELARIVGELRQAGAEDNVIASFERARLEAESIFTETEFREFLSRQSELAR